MATMNVSLPDELKAWVEEQAKGGGYATASDVVRDLVRQAVRREKALAEMNAAIDAGIRSGFVENYDPVERRRRLEQELRAKRNKVA